jgi:hypothetical protein
MSTKSPKNETDDFIRRAKSACLDDMQTAMVNILEADVAVHPFV